ncbi:MAG: hypothetical protein EBS52_03240 [Betaproteobacteria bacterium]|nr:hypothetical protein [Betaproteobacteria bacterium]
MSGLESSILAPDLPGFAKPAEPKLCPNKPQGLEQAWAIQGTISVLTPLFGVSTRLWSRANVAALAAWLGFRAGYRRGWMTRDQQQSIES